MKGQQDVLSTILISGILIGVVGSVYFWGIPLIEKNQDISTLRNSEDFMTTLNEKIKFIANNGGKDELRINVPGTLDIKDGMVELRVDTKGTIYATEAEIPLSRNECARTEGTWGIHDSSILCVKSNKIDINKIITTYSLDYILLNVIEAGGPTRSFEIVLSGEATGGQERTIVIENTGTTEGDTTMTNVRLDIL